ncbi:hypothetical protein [Pedobacter cryoconitis]|uniref:Uncharacterized protein n=1 Tax=Pedobacter cryoconitis TaxID=188932 RepID=A0A327SQW4_9SPHI|nr:hypothetical protein [Pedobacter cryoconitis]RAJ28097.1 hypothetical protein LY11_03417 [Pedobacter cryoconitis]
MKTTVIESNKGKEKVNSSAVNSKAEKDKVNGLPISSSFEDNAKGETPAGNAEEQKPLTENVQAQAKSEAPKAQAEQPTAEPTKAEIKAKLAEEKPALNLEQTLKKIKDLGRLSNQRDKLIETTDTLDAFEIAQMDEAEETNVNHYQGCTLIIKDDTGREFKTKNPFIIDKTANQIKTLCYDKLAEVEAQISLTL